MMNYKNTLNLPNTKFPMKANLNCNEHFILKNWEKDNLYNLIRMQKSKKEFFLLHDGPIYANGDIHLGHAINRILKDIILKFKSLSGYNTPYIPGWDCHGLPVELRVEQLIKKLDIKNISDNRFREICREYVLEQVENQKKDFIRLGILGDWTDPYLTMDFKTEANIVRTLNKVISHGYLYKGVKPIYWCFECQSALSNSEIEYREHRVYAVDVSFVIADNIKIKNIFNINVLIEKIELMIWTTMIWTIPANQAIAVHPDYIYQLIEIFNVKYVIVAADLVKVFMKRIKCSSWRILGESLGNDLENLRVLHPFMLFDIPIILSDHVTLDTGTGAVHVAPNYGLDDYIIAQKYNLKKIADLINDQGYYLSNTHPQLNGVHVFKINNVMINLINQSGNLLYVHSNYQHSYPHCWRHKVPVIFRATSQWFLNMDHNNLRNKLLQIVREKVVWIPNKGSIFMELMIINRPDWCVSRQRVWGIPIPILIHKNTDTIHPRTCELMEVIAQKIELEGIQAWWNLKVEDIIGSEEAIEYKKVTDTLDVWFDSGSTYDSIISDRFKDLKGSPVDLNLEGSDQYRGWFMSSLILSVIINNQAPYKVVLSHGFTVDSQGRKMSKSVGNVVNPKDLINEFGADILRLWTASSDYSKDMAISSDSIKHVTDIYRRIRNTIRFCLANLKDFNPDKDSIYPEDMVLLDRWIVNRAFYTQSQIILDYNVYLFHSVTKRIMHFCSMEMGSLYLDIIKDRQYTLKKDSVARRSCQTALFHIVEAMVRWIAPILSFTADEIWQYVPGSRSKYVFTEEWYDGLFKIDKRAILQNSDWDIFFEARNKINKIIEKARIDRMIKGSLEANIILYVTPKLATILHILGNELKFGLIVSSVVVLDYNEFNVVNKNQISWVDKELKIILEKSKGIKCLRCWNYVLNLSQHTEYVNICDRCIQNIVGYGEDRKFF